MFMTLCVCVLVSDVNNSLRQAGPGTIPGTKLGEYKAVSLYQNILNNGDEIPSILSAKQDRFRAQRMLNHFEALISPQEKQILKSKEYDDGQKELILQHLSHLLVALFVWVHCRKTPDAVSKKDMQSKVPPGLKKKMEGTIGSDLMVCVCVCLCVSR